jgi:ribosomal protein S18 acetylase RimI-like enzyme
MPDVDPFSIRSAIPSDIDAVWNLLDSCRAALLDQGIDQWDAIYPSVDTVRADIAAARLFVLTVDTHCGGAITLDGDSDSSYASLPWAFAEPALIIHRLCVSPSLQGKGIGQRLMEFAERHAAAMECRSIRLDAYSGNRAAIAFYQRRGYRQVGELFFPRRSLPFYLFEWSVP